MPKCSVIGCGIKPKNKQHKITYHRLPTIAKKRKAWLDIIGQENVHTARKCIFICSLHFEAASFNHTMNIAKLRDGALPSKKLLPAGPKPSGSLCAINQNEEAVDCPEIVNNVQHNIETRSSIIDPLCETSPVSAVTMTKQGEGVTKCIITPPPFELVTLSSFPASPREKQPGSSADANPRADDISPQTVQALTKLKMKCQQQSKKIKRLNEIVRRQKNKIPQTEQALTKLKMKCQEQSKQIKRLNEKERRQKNKIASLKNIIQDLKKPNYLNSDMEMLVKQCALFV